MSSLKWDTLSKSVGEVLSEVMTLIDNDPVYQRGRIHPSDVGVATPSKSQSIINSILQGFDLGEITLVRTARGSASPYETLDGAHRMRAIRDFHDNKFPTHRDLAFGGKLYKQLDREQREAFKSYVLRIVTYDGVSNDMKGLLFRLRNGGTPVNHMEMLNAYGNIPIADFIRNTARKIIGYSTEPHKLFHSIMIRDAKDGELKEKHQYVKFPNNRLCHDEMVARITYMYYKGGNVVACDKKELQEMYEDHNLTEDKVTRIGKKVHECLDFMRDVAEARKSFKRGHGLSTNEFTMLYRWYISFTKQNGPVRLISANTFYMAFERSLSLFCGDDKSSLISGTYQETPRSDPRLLHEVFKGYLGAHNSTKKIEKTCEWLSNEGGFDPVGIGALVVMDSARTFSTKMIEEQLASQGYRCWVTGEKLTMKDAHGGHIVPHSKGGQTTYNNLVVIHKNHNITMSDMNALDYRDQYRERNGS